MAQCRFCDEASEPQVHYSTRHYAHFACYLNAGKKLGDLHAWQVRQFPYRLLKHHGLLGTAVAISEREPD